MSEYIEYVRVTIEPVEYLPPFGRRPITQLQVDVKTDVQDYHYQRILRPDEFTARFDQLMDVARREIKRLIETRRGDVDPSGPM